MFNAIPSFTSLFVLFTYHVLFLLKDNFLFHLFFLKSKFEACYYFIQFLKLLYTFNQTENFQYFNWFFSTCNLIHCRTYWTCSEMYDVFKDFTFFYIYRKQCNIFYRFNLLEKNYFIILFIFLGRKKTKCLL